VVRVDESHDREEIEDHVATDGWNGGKREVGRQQFTSLDQGAPTAFQQLVLEDLPVIQADRSEVVCRIDARQQELRSFSSSRQHPGVHEAHVLGAEHGEE